MALMVGSHRAGGGAAGAAPPAPTAPGVRLAVAGGEVVAVLRFAGYITPATAEAARQRLLAALREGEGARGARRGPTNSPPPPLPDGRFEADPPNPHRGAG